MLRRPLSPEENFYLDFRLVLAAGESLGAYADNLGVVSLQASGFEFVEG